MTATVIALMNQKGGTGKTTASQHASLCMASLGHKVLFIDADPQRTAYKFFLKNHKLFPQGYDGVIDVAKMKVDALNDLSEFKNKYDYIFIDTQPALGENMAKLIRLSDIIVISTQPKYKDVEATEEIANAIHQMKIQKPELIAQFLISRKKSNANISKSIEKLNGMNFPIFATHIREYNLYEDADEQGKSVIHLDKGKYVDKAAQDIHQFTNELITLSETL